MAIERKALTYNKKVIEFPLFKGWRFFDYVDGSNPVEQWYVGELSEDAQFAFTATLKDIQKVENPQHWLCFKRFLSGQYRKHRIWELWFQCGDKRQYRILGTFGPERWQVTLLTGCFHKSKVYTPPDALDLAYKRAAALTEGRAQRYERQIPVDR